MTRTRNFYPAYSAFTRQGRNPRSFRRWLTLVIGGGFAGTLAALQLVPGERADAVVERAIPASSTAPGDELRARFSFCHRGGGVNCVVDGDTFWFRGEKIRIADIDTPETHPARCPEEQALGDAATRQLHDWLNAGAFSLELIDRDTDRYGRKLRVVTRGGSSVGDLLVGQGLARWWEGRRRPWC